MIRQNRIIYSDNGVLTDISSELNNFHSGTKAFTFVAAEDAIYIGSDLPFNQRHFELSAFNAATSATISVSLWGSSGWESAVDVADGTSTSGKSMGQSGVVEWVPERGKSWIKQDTDNTITGLSSLKIYNLYWAKITFSANISFTASFLGYKFATDEQVGSLYPELALSTTIAQFATGKTTWFEQHCRCAEMIVRDLVSKELIASGNQLLDWSKFSESSIHKLAHIVFTAFGDDYKDNLAQADKDYYSSLQNGIRYGVDKNKNATLDLSESFGSVGVVRR